jgi:predicted metal-binding membrane protein
LLFGLAALGWVVTDDRMSGMDAGPGTDPGEIGFYVTVWVVMMAAMMFPSASPTVLTYARLQQARREKGVAAPIGAVPLFLVGYLATWTAAGLVGYAIIKLARTVEIDALSWSEGGPYIAGAVILFAAVYQLTPLKNVCLTHCRGPLFFLIEHWHDGRSGALRMGAVHGSWCVGCCWALMFLLFVVGVMNLVWVAAIAIFVLGEKLLARGRDLGRVIGSLLIGWGLYTLAF